MRVFFFKISWILALLLTLLNQHNYANNRADNKKQIPLKKSPETRIVVIGDSDIFSNRLGLRQNQSRDSAKFIINLLDWIVLDKDMLSVLSSYKKNGLSSSTKRILQNLEDEVSICGYFSKDLPPPWITNLGAIKNICVHYKTESAGKISLRFTDPADNPPLRPKEMKELQVNKVLSKEPPYNLYECYYSLVVRYGNRYKILPDYCLFNLRFLEYELTSAIKYLSSSPNKIDKKESTRQKVGIVIENLYPSHESNGHTKRSSEEFTNLKNILEQDFSVQPVSLKKGQSIPEDFEVLLFIRPKEVIEEAKYEIDQFVMRGGALLLCLEMCEIKQAQPDPGDPNAQGSVAVVRLETNLTDLLGHWGIKIKPEVVLDESCLSTTQKDVDPQNPGETRSYTYKLPYALWIKQDSLNTEHLSLAQVKNLCFLLACPINIDERRIKGKRIVELVKSSEKSWLAKEFNSVLAVAGEEVSAPANSSPQTLAIALVGSFESFYESKETLPSKKDKK